MMFSYYLSYRRLGLFTVTFSNYLFVFFFFKQKTAYEMRISDWSSDVCSSDLSGEDMIPPDLAAEVNPFIGTTNGGNVYPGATMPFGMVAFSPEATPLPGRSFPITAPGGYEWRANDIRGFALTHLSGTGRSEEHTSELQSLMRISYAVFCLTKKHQGEQ